MEIETKLRTAAEVVAALENFPDVEIRELALSDEIPGVGLLVPTENSFSHFPSELVSSVQFLLRLEPNLLQSFSAETLQKFKQDLMEDNEALRELIRIKEANAKIRAALFKALN